ncbi:hypothetical protein SUGI_0586840 [Cryptomeria japonica]|uniref:uncharacterized protein LOC131064218 n=1 Tax=Cryptomeria japonica TaxID=3369 RepID=UPI0024148BD7|nr:uncharacterized protein LOC131064218 [Cryptomeria japonica]GLJ29738.1 hypothetical protein SUGI_0586840 [Cryptomeria japonica]
MEEKPSGFSQWGAFLRPSRRSSYIKSRQISSGGDEEAKAQSSDGSTEKEKSKAQIEMLLSKAGRRIASAVKGLVKRVENSRGVESIKDFLLGGYHRLSKPSSFHLFSCMENPKKGFRHCDPNFCNDSDGFYAWSTDQEEDMKMSANCTPKKDLAQNFQLSGNIQGNCNFLKVKSDHEDRRNKLKKVAEEKEKCSARLRAEAYKKMEKKLKEIVVLDNNSVEDVLDIEEFLHCYSRLTCPFYIDMVNRFFLDISSDFD